MNQPTRCTATSSCTTPPPTRDRAWCPRHHARARRALTDISLAWHVATTSSDTLAPRTNPAARRGHGAAPPAPANLHALAIFDDRTRYAPISWLTELAPTYSADDADTVNPRDMLTYWCGHIAARIGIPPPPDITGMITYLQRNLTTATLLPIADQLYDDLHDLTRALQTAIGDTPPQPLGTCPHLDTDEHGQIHECGGHIWPRYPTTPTAPLGAECATCRRTWTGPDLIRLRLILDLDAREKNTP